MCFRLCAYLLTYVGYLILSVWTILCTVWTVCVFCHTCFVFGCVSYYIVCVYVNYCNPDICGWTFWFNVIPGHYSPSASGEGLFYRSQVKAQW